MRKPKVVLPPEDPATKAAREREERRAEGLRTEETQSLLLGDTVRRLRRFGRIGSGGSVPIYGGGGRRGGGGGTVRNNGGGGSFAGSGRGLDGSGFGGSGPSYDNISIY